MALFIRFTDIANGMRADLPRVVYVYISIYIYINHYKYTPRKCILYLKLSSHTEKNISMTSSDENLVDLVWNADTESPRPAYNNGTAYEHKIEYAGEYLEHITIQLFRLQELRTELHCTPYNFHTPYA